MNLQGEGWLLTGGGMNKKGKKKSPKFSPKKIKKRMEEQPKGGRQWKTPAELVGGQN